MPTMHSSILTMFAIGVLGTVAPACGDAPLAAVDSGTVVDGPIVDAVESVDSSPGTLITITRTDTAGDVLAADLLFVVRDDDGTWHVPSEKAPGVFVAYVHGPRYDVVVVCSYFGGSGISRAVYARTTLDPTAFSLGRCVSGYDTVDISLTGTTTSFPWTIRLPGVFVRSATGSVARTISPKRAVGNIAVTTGAGALLRRDVDFSAVSAIDLTPDVDAYPYDDLVLTLTGLRLGDDPGMARVTSFLTPSTGLGVSGPFVIGLMAKVVPVAMERVGDTRRLTVQLYDGGAPNSVRFARVPLTGAVTTLSVAMPPPLATASAELSTGTFHWTGMEVAGPISTTFGFDFLDGDPQNDALSETATRFALDQPTTAGNRALPDLSSAPGWIAAWSRPTSSGVWAASMSFERTDSQGLQGVAWNGGNGGQ